MKRDELQNLQWLSQGLLYNAKARRFDIVIEVKQATPLPAAVADIKQHIPFPKTSLVPIVWTAGGGRR